MLALLSVLVILVCVLLVAVILLQNPKGGGLNSSAFGGTGSSLFGARKTGDYLEKGTWYLIILLCVLTLGSKIFIGSGKSQQAESPQLEQFDYSKYTTPSSTSLNPSANNKPKKPEATPAPAPNPNGGIVAPPPSDPD